LSLFEPLCGNALERKDREDFFLNHYLWALDDDLTLQDPFSFFLSRLSTQSFEDVFSTIVVYYTQTNFVDSQRFRDFNIAVDEVDDVDGFDLRPPIDLSRPRFTTRPTRPADYYEMNSSNSLMQSRNAASFPALWVKNYRMSRPARRLVNSI
jgi:hypothetical protein